MSSEGYVYVANTQGYMDEALSSLRSLQRSVPGAAVTIITEPDMFQPDLEGVHWLPLLRKYDSPVIKTEAIRAPYDRCIFIDTDTRIIGDISDLFAILDAFDIAAAHEPTRGWDYETPAARAFPELNTGVLAFRNTDRVRRFFEDWTARYAAIRDAQGLKNDQPAFRATIWDSADIRHATLTTEYHLVTGKGASIAWDAKLLHGRDDLEALEAQINTFYGPRVLAPGWGVIPQVSGRKQRIGIFASLTRHFLAGLGSAGGVKARASPVKWW